MDARRLDWTAEDARQQISDFATGQRLQLDPFAELVLPEGSDRVGRGFPGTDGREHACFLRAGHLVDQYRRRLVEGVGVVDDENQWRVRGALSQFAAQRAERIVAPRGRVDFG